MERAARRPAPVSVSITPHPFPRFRYFLALARISFFRRWAIKDSVRGPL